VEEVPDTISTHTENIARGGLQEQEEEGEEESVLLVGRDENYDERCSIIVG
jgi:hypothetical protein